MDEQRNDSRWWSAKPGEPVDARLWAHAKALRAAAEPDAWRDRLYQRIYLSQSGKLGRHAAAMQMLKDAGIGAAKLNVVHSKTQALIAKVAKRPPAIRVSPDDARFELRRRSKLLRKFLLGLWEHNDVQAQASAVARDACIARTGILKVYGAHGKIRYQRVRRRDLLVDPHDARDGEPTQLIHHATIARERLMAMFEGDREAQSAIRSADRVPAGRFSDEMDTMPTLNCDMVEFAEAWHLPSSPTARDGRRALVIEGKTLVHEEWTRARFPFGRFHYEQPLDSYWGASCLMHELAGLQLLINRTVARIQESIDFCSAPLWKVRAGANVNYQHLATNRPRILEYDGHEPKLEFPPALSHDQLRILEFYLAQADEISGVNRLDQTGRTDAGAAASGVAIQEREDIRSERFFHVQGNQDRGWVEVADLSIDAAKDLAQDPKSKLSSLWSERGLMRRIEWDDVDMERDAFDVQLEPASFFPDSRAGKYQLANEMAQNGIIQGAQVAAAFDEFPDIRRLMKASNAPYEYAQWFVSGLEDLAKDPPTYDPDCNLEVLWKEVNANYHLLLTDPHAEKDEPAEVLQRHRDAMTAIDRKLREVEASQAPAPAPVEAGALPPGAAPTALPGEALPGLPA